MLEKRDWRYYNKNVYIVVVKTKIPRCKLLQFLIIHITDFILFMMFKMENNIPQNKSLWNIIEDEYYQSSFFIYFTKYLWSVA